MMTDTLPDFPEFNLGRVRLREIRASDLPQIFLGLSDPVVTAHYGVSYDSLESCALQMQWYEQLRQQQQGIWWALCTEHDATLIGACGFNDWHHQHHSLAIGYWLLPAYWGQGLLQLALPAILRYAFLEMKVHRIHAEIEPDNLASQRALEKLGFSYEGTQREVEFKAGRYLSLQHFSLLASDAAARNLLTT